VKFKRFKLTPLLIALSVLVLVCGVRVMRPDFLVRLEQVTYDLRVREAARFPAPVATNLAFVSIEESGVRVVKSGELGYSYGLLWPRQVYGRLVEELAAQGAEVVGFDVLFAELRHDHPLVQMSGGGLEESDDFFANQMHRAGDIVLAVTPELLPPRLFVTNALALGDISREEDSDGILRRTKAFSNFRLWHPLFQQLAADPEISADLNHARFAPQKIILPQTGTTNLIEISVDAENNFSTADFVGDKLRPGLPSKAKAFTEERIWDMGIVLAAQQLRVNLSNAIVNLPHGEIILRGEGGIVRTIPVDSGGSFLVDWRLTPNDTNLLRMPIEALLRQDRLRLLGETNDLHDDFRGKLVVVGSAIQGEGLTDRGATPLESDTLLVSKHWNVANSVITDQFVRRFTLTEDLALTIGLGLITAFLSWQLRAFAASIATILLIAGYVAVTFVVFIKYRVWMPVVIPVLGAILIEHICLVTHRVVFEEREQRRVKSVFSKIVSPDVVNELLGAEKLSLGGTRREISVLFADIRGFTTLTDQAQEHVAEFVRAHGLDQAAAEKCFDESARETLETVNLYLAAVADAVKKHGGTLDKYIGDCVMAFWNAPINDEKHAQKCVQAAIDAQRAIDDLNKQRLALNVVRDLENRDRAAAGLPAKPMLAALQLGTGINTGMVTVGLMGSDQHILNYTAFGREVNLASRLEGVSGSGRIVISDTTYKHLTRESPELAATCVEMPAVAVKGIRNAVGIYEVRWK
jgi:class 3 adenylate cyclase/CHASE2 domain-containing sensor protein